MSSKISKLSLLTIAAFVGSITYCLCTYLSWTFFPLPFTPLTNYLSQLGNYSYNPNGAIFYNIAVMQAGLLSFLFYLGMYFTYRNLPEKKLLTAGLIAGLVNALAVFLAGFFSEDLYTLHFISGFSIFFFWVPVLALVNLVFVKQTGFIRWVSVYGFFLAILNASFVGTIIFAFSTVFAILEWIAIFGFLLWASLVTIQALWDYWKSIKTNKNS